MLHVVSAALLLLIAPVVWANDTGRYQELTTAQVEQAAVQSRQQLQAADELAQQAAFRRELAKNQATIQSLPLPATQTVVNIRDDELHAPDFNVDDLVTPAESSAPTSRMTPLIMVSLSFPESSLKGLVAEAQRLATTVTYRGMKGDSFRQMRDELVRMQSEGEIDPTLFNRFGVTDVPTFILPLEPVPMCNSDSCPAGRHVKVSGLTSLETALEFISRNSREQEAKDLAEKWLAQLRAKP